MKTYTEWGQTIRDRQTIWTNNEDRQYGHTWRQRRQTIYLKF
jgi:hypothetical protein